jgi:hypothetical protein
MTNPPSGVTMTPASPLVGPSTVVRKLRGMPVVRFILGLLSYSRLSFVGHS